MTKKLLPSDPELVFITGAVWKKEHIDLIAENGSMGVLIRLIEGEFEVIDITFPPIALVSTKEFKSSQSENKQQSRIIYFFGPEGDVLKVDEDDVTHEDIDDGVNGPSRKGIIRDAKMINGRPYVVGMNRQAYRLSDNDQWEHIDNEILNESRSIKDIVGLQTLDAYSENDIYSAGLKGEIWHFDGSKWQQIDSPTDVSLNAVCCTPEYVYIAGTAGVLLRGKGGHFESIEHSMDLGNLYHLAWFNDKLYIAGPRKLFVYNGETIEELDLGMGDDITIGTLHCNDGLLMSVGAKHILTTEDGETWEQVFIER